MKEGVDIECKDGAQLSIRGILSFATVPAIWQQGKTLILQSHGPVCIDLADVTASNSGGLAMLLDWLRIAKKHDIHLHLLNIPAQLHAVAKACGIDSELRH